MQRRGTVERRQEKSRTTLEYSTGGKTVMEWETGKENRRHPNSNAETRGQCQWKWERTKAFAYIDKDLLSDSVCLRVPQAPTPDSARRGKSIITTISFGDQVTVSTSPRKVGQKQWTQSKNNRTKT